MTEPDKPERNYRPALVRAVFRGLLVFAVIVPIAALFHPETPLPEEWNPLKPLDVAAPVTSLTQWKLRAALADDAACLTALADGNVTADPLPPLEDSMLCHIRPRVALRAVGDATLAPVETRCQTALRLAMWERHGLQAAARRHMGQRVAEIRHFSSYNCREIRTPQGSNGRMSQHATADAIDISGFVLSGGETVDLKRDWTAEGPRRAFLRDAFDSACLWFVTALGPEFNSLHADHFHLQTRGWGYCR